MLINALRAFVNNSKKEIIKVLENANECETLVKVLKYISLYQKVV